VNGKIVSRAKIDLAVKQRVAQGQPDNEQLRRGLLDVLINQELLSQEAERRGLLKIPESQVQIELVRQSAIANLVLDDHVRAHPVSDDTARAEYDKIREQRGTREYRARHILVETEAGARQIIEKLQKGEKFEDLARESKDPGSKERGGDLDWAAPGNFVAPFSQAMVKLDKGKFTETPVQSQFGWHVIRLDDTRSTQFPPFEQVKQQIVNGLQQQEVQKFIADLRARAKIELP
jgi:peptidyl-prolyl cis-trans isomerase C